MTTPTDPNAPLRGLKGKEYRNAWNKLHRDRMREVQRRFRQRHRHIIGKKTHQYYLKTRGVAQCTYRSRLTEPFATQARQPWGPVEDALLFSGMTESELVRALGRTLRAIQRRKHRLRQQEEHSHD